MSKEKYPSDLKFQKGENMNEELRIITDELDEIKKLLQKIIRYNKNLEDKIDKLASEVARIKSYT
jgi:regulator of replication initiation timing